MIGQKVDIESDNIRENYPVLMNNTHFDITVMFYSEGTGIVVYSNCTQYQLGYHTSNWSMSHKDWVLTKSTIQLKNN